MLSTKLLISFYYFYEATLGFWPTPPAREARLIFLKFQARILVRNPCKTYSFLMIPGRTSDSMAGPRTRISAYYFFPHTIYFRILFLFLMTLGFPGRPAVLDFRILFPRILFSLLSALGSWRGRPELVTRLGGRN